jgi:translation initiation factor 2 subunit 2
MWFVMEYEEALERAFRQIKPIEAVERFEIPKATGFVEGIKTIITNFSYIADMLKRPQEHIAKYLAKELATSFVIQKPRLILNRKLKIQQIDEKIEKYVREYVICKNCKKPDTSLVVQDKVTFLQCMACGSRYPVPKV